MHNRIEKIEKAIEMLTVTSSLGVPGDVSAEFLKALGEIFGCDWGTYWKVTGVCLKPAIIWNSDKVTARALVLDTTNRTLSLSEGTAGHVWRSRRPTWTDDILADMCLPRSLDASASGFRGGIWFAVKTNTAVFGVVELLGKKLESGTDELLVAIEHLGVKMGRVLERGSMSPPTL